MQLMQAASRSDADILERFDVAFDETAEPVDYDEVLLDLLDLLDKIVERRLAARTRSAKKVESLAAVTATVVEANK